MIINHDFRQNLVTDDTAPTRLDQKGTTSRGQMFVGFDQLLPIMFAGAAFDAALIIPARRFAEFDAATFAHLSPKIVLSPLFMARFDVMDFAHKLCELNFTGRYHAVVSALPDTAMVRREVNASFPDIVFDVVELDRLNR